VKNYLVGAITTWLVRRNPVDILRQAAHEARVKGHKVNLSVKPYGGDVEIL